MAQSLFYSRSPVFYPNRDSQVRAYREPVKIEELEALRLNDLEGLEQEECAAKMEVSRQTFQRILITAR